jgi:hypothetical protein
MTSRELLSTHGIELPNCGPGRYYTTCPQCSRGRSKEHRNNKVLGVTIEADSSVRWGCNHCNWTGPQKGNGGNQVERTNYIYRDLKGVPIFRKVRNTPGRKPPYYIQKPDGNGNWLKGAEGVDTKTLYRIDEVAKAIAAGHSIAVVEGEKDADNLWRIGIAATTSAHGTSDPLKNQKPKWLPEHSKLLKDADIVVFNDHDPPGYFHAETCCRLSVDIAKSVRRLDLAKHWPTIPKGGDVSDWLEKGGGTEARLRELIEKAPEYEYRKAEQEPAAAPDKGKKAADVLIELSARAEELFHAPDGTAYATIPVGDHLETWPIRSKGFRRWLAREFFTKTSSAPNSDAIQSALNVIEARAHFDGAQRPVHIRVGAHDGRLYLDLADTKWRAVEITSTGWQIIDNPPIRFRRAAGMLPLPEPVRGGKIEDLRSFLNIKDGDAGDQDFVLTVSFNLAALRERGPYPPLNLIGEHGAAKSTFARVLRKLIDPNSAPLRALPREDRDLFIAANNGHLLVFDNVSKMPDWISDTLCRLATGGGFAARQLYSDGEEALFDAMRPIVLNGIEDIIGRPDLADRAIFLALENISDEKRKPEKKFWEDFDAAHPCILGALLDGVAHGLQKLPNIHLDRTPRMADFATWATACETAYWQAGTFAQAYEMNREDAIGTVIEADLVATAVQTFMAERTKWAGTATDLLGALKTTVGEDQAKLKEWPSTPRSLSGRVRRQAATLRRVGIDITLDDKSPDRKRTRLIKLAARKAGGSDRPQPSDRPNSRDFSDIGADGRADGPSDEPQPTVRTNETADHRADDGPDGASADNPLKNKASDGADDTDANSHTHTGRPVCAQCRGEPDGRERLVAYGGETIWLHAECERFFLQARKAPPKRAMS